MADLTDGFAVGMHFANQLKHLRISAQLVRRPSPGNENAVILRAFQFVEAVFGLGWNAVFSNVGFSFFFAGQMHFRTFLTNPMDRVP
ncbi:hypothetical protein D1872_274390 [compost metagenome]